MFNELKHRLVNPPILPFIDFTLQFVLHTDASGLAKGAVLNQTQDGRKQCVIGYWSRKLQKTERNCSTTEKEGLAVAAIIEFYPYLNGFYFELLTDRDPVILN